MKSLLASLSFVVLAVFSAQAAHHSPNRPSQNPQAPLKKWTLLVYINGHNDLDQYGKMNIVDMEKIGSTEDLDIVVQWASLRASTTKRIWVKKNMAQGQQSNEVMSPIVENMPPVDMGQKKSLVDFVTWGMQTYPAQNYFVVMWNHGTGWHDSPAVVDRWSRTAGPRFDLFSGPVRPNEISYDDRFNSFITNKQMGEAFAEIYEKTNNKIEIIGADACLMAMGEVVGELAPYANHFFGSEELEPSEGWPYSMFLRRWVAEMATASSIRIGEILTEEYIKAYSQGGFYHFEDSTFSTMDLTFYKEWTHLLKNWVHSMLGNLNKREVIKVALKAQRFDSPDYKDLMDFIQGLESKDLLTSEASKHATTALKSNFRKFVPFNQTTPLYSRAQGFSLWLPAVQADYDDYKALHKTTRFAQDSDWGLFVDALFE